MCPARGGGHDRQRGVERAQGHRPAEREHEPGVSGDVRRPALEVEADRRRQRILESEDAAAGRQGHGDQGAESDPTACPPAFAPRAPSGGGRDGPGLGFLQGRRKRQRSAGIIPFWPGTLGSRIRPEGAKTCTGLSHGRSRMRSAARTGPRARHSPRAAPWHRGFRSEEHTSELQSRSDLVCRLLLEKKKKKKETKTKKKKKKTEKTKKTN